jgi:hypothetical protein
VCGGVGREKITVANGNHALSGRSHRDGVTSDGAENAPRLRVTYGEDSKESVPPLKHRVRTHTASAQGSSTPVPWRWRSRGARISGPIDRRIEPSGGVPDGPELCTALATLQELNETRQSQRLGGAVLEQAQAVIDRQVRRRSRLVTIGASHGLWVPSAANRHSPVSAPRPAISATPSTVVQIPGLAWGPIGTVVLTHRGVSPRDSESFSVRGSGSERNPMRLACTPNALSRTRESTPARLLGANPVLAVGNTKTPGAATPGVWR